MPFPDMRVNLEGMGNVNTEIIGRPYGCISLHPHEELVIMELLEHPEKSLAKIADVLYSETGSPNICSTLCRYLKRNNITCKKVCGHCRFRFVLITIATKI